ncbi:universal stress protein [Halobaculum sp. MBLA0147]|uniref:universal stress protein n=1 Tax=Halobaculum sp. MBLA0147 TaxID=3079934 RepID=UPI0035248C04
MTLLVPYDALELADTALARAAAFGDLLEERVLAVTVVPEHNARYARERGWLAADEPFDRETIHERLREQIREIAPHAATRFERVDRNAPSGTISTRLRRVAASEDTSMVFVGSDSAGRLTRSIASVGSGVAADAAYDVVIVRRPGPSTSETLRDVEPEAE